MTDKIDFNAVNQAAMMYIDRFLAEYLPGGKQVGHEYVVRNPTRPDQSAGSFKVNVRTGAWSDFATGDSGGDLVSLYAYLFTAGKQGDAAKQLIEQLGLQLPAYTQPKKKETKGKQQIWTPVLPVPAGSGEVPAAHRYKGKYSRRWAYLDRSGKLLGYVCRFDKDDGSKDILPLTYCKNAAGEMSWQWRSFPLPRPLFGLERLDRYPDAPVLLVEGEKCAAAGQALLTIPVMSWIGGSKATDKIDLSPLAGRKVILWPDNDDPGHAAMHNIARLLEGKASHISFIIPNKSSSQGWDIADAIAEGWATATLVSAIDQAIDVNEYARRFGDSGGGAGRGKNPPLRDAAAENTVSYLGTRHTDRGAALDLIDMFGDKLRYNARPFGKWFCYDGTHWEEDRTNKVFEYLDLMIRGLLEEAAQIESSDSRKALEKWIFKLEGMSRQKAVISKAETLQEISIRVEDFDRSDTLFNCTNVTLDLDGGDVVPRPHCMDDYITVRSPVMYDPDAKCPKWEKFLHRIFDKDEELIEFMRRAIGYSLTGDVSEQKLFFAFGTGANGKSVFFETIRYVLGDYAGKAPTEMLMQQQYNQIPTDVADLRGKRFVVASEVDDGRRWAEARIKDLTGGDTIKARRMREDFFEFRQTHKLWVFGNHKPTLRGNDVGIKRRLKIIPFTIQIPDEEKIPMAQMLAMLRAEASGILNWALEGYRRWWEIGLGAPQSVDDATQEYFDDNDILLQFITECCVVGDHYTAVGKKLWEAYHGWCDSNGIRSLSSKGFYRVLEERGFTKRSGTGNKTVVDGIDLDNTKDDQNES